MIEAYPMPEESREELLSRLSASDRPVTSRQLERWCKAGKVTRPVRRHARGVRGSVSYFPPQAFEQAAAMFDASRHVTGGDRRLRVRGFLLWWQGKPIAEDPRALLLKAVAPMLRPIDRIRNEPRTEVINEPPEDDEDIAFDIADAYVSRHAHELARGSVLRRMRRNLGKRSEDVLSVMSALLTAALGGAPILDRPSLPGDDSLAFLVLKSFGGDDFRSMAEKAQVNGSVPASSQESPRAEDQIHDILDLAGNLFDRGKLNDFVASLRDEELNAARRYARVLFDDLPVVFESHELLFGKNRFAATTRILSRLPTEAIAFSVIGVAWLVRVHGGDRFQSIVENIEQARPRAEALCTLARAFPDYRELFLSKNVDRLAALPDDTRQEMWDSIRTLVTP
jgi:hypothetical protein